MNLFRQISCAIAASCVIAPALAAEGPVPTGVSRLDHVFVIMMENHGYGQIIGNPAAPFTNALAAHFGLATNYYAVAHPSLTNYLEIVGGSNFGVLNDNAPDWHNAACTSNLASGTPSLESTKSPICPISGTGTDATTPVFDYSNETSDPSHALNQAVVEVDGTVSFAAAAKTSGKSIADQLVAAGRSWKSYQEDLPPTGADRVNSADGWFSNLNSPTTAGLPGGDLVGLYAVKHNPFAYFTSVQAGSNPQLSLARVVPFDGPHGLYQDLASGKVPNLSFIAPNQCHDQHGRGNAGANCDYDANNDGTLNGLNPGLIFAGDLQVERLVTSIRQSSAWHQGHNAIVILWDEDDYSVYPTTNQVPLIVVTNDRDNDHDADDGAGRSDSNFYTHFSLLKTLEAGFHLPCLNHACDASTSVITGLFDR